MAENKRPRDFVLAAIKKGCTTRSAIEKETGFTSGQVHNSIKALRKWGDIATNMRGKYSIPTEEKRKPICFGTEENNF
jgi:predicted transcriptional regulator